MKQDNLKYLTASCSL